MKMKLHAWCLLEKSENEHWQEVISKKSKLKLQKLAHESLLSVENYSCASPRKVIEVKDHWSKHQSRTGHRSCRACHVGRNVPASEIGWIARAQQKKFVVATSGRMDQRQTWVRKPYHSNSVVKVCTGAKNAGSANVAKPMISMRKVVQPGDVVVLDEKNSHIRDNRDGTVIKLDVNSGVYTMDMWVCLDEFLRVSKESLKSKTIGQTSVPQWTQELQGMSCRQECSRE